MPFTLAMQVDPFYIYTAVAVIAIALVVAGLGMVGRELEHRTRLLRLHSEAKALRQKQNDRLRALGIKSRPADFAPILHSANDASIAA